MKAFWTETGLRLEPEGPDDLDRLRGWRRQRLQAVGRGAAAIEVLIDGTPRASWAVLQALARAVGRRGPDWCAGIALVAVAAWLWRVGAARVAPAVWLGVALLASVGAAGVLAGLSWRGVAPIQSTRRWWRWAYWWAAGHLLLGAAGVSLAVLLWLGWVLGSLAWRLMP